MDRRNSQEVPVRRDDLPNTLLTGFDKNVCLDRTAPGGMGRRPSGRSPRDSALLDIYTPKGPEGHKINPVAPSLKRAVPHKFDCQRRSENSRWNRATLGMMMPGVSWFLTLTTSPQSKNPVRKDYDNFWRKWWRVNYPGLQTLWVETNEGLGVIHAIMRFPRSGITFVPTQPMVQNEWQVRHQAFSTWSRVSHLGKMANYQRQKQKELTAGEIKKQSLVLSWNYSRGWLPPGFLKVWGRAWTDTIRLIPKVEQPRVIADWIAAVLANPENLDIPPVFENNLVLEYYVD